MPHQLTLEGEVFIIVNDKGNVYTTAKNNHYKTEANAKRALAQIPESVFVLSEEARPAYQQAIAERNYNVASDIYNKNKVEKPVRSTYQVRRARITLELL